MTIKHFIKLIIPRFKWFVRSKKNFLRQYKKLKKVSEIRAKGRKLEVLLIKKHRQNTDGSLKEAYGISKQIEILEWILK